MSIGAISAISAAGTDSVGASALSGLSTPLTTGAGLGTDATSATSGVDFAGTLAGGLEKLDAVQKKADGLAVQAATGDLKDAHDYTMAATQAELTTELTVTLRNKALDAFGEIMRMQG